MCKLPAAGQTDAPGADRGTAEAPAQPIGDSKTGPAKKTRRKLWDLPQSLHCPIIGTCLEVEELRRLARKARCRHAAPLSDYDVHVSFVSTAGERNVLSLAAHKALEKKHAACIRRFAQVRTRPQLVELWGQALARGEVPGAFWATLTHPRCDAALRDQLREQVHMLSHQIGAGQRADLRRLAEAEAELDRLRHNFDALLKRSRQQLQARERRLLDLEAELREAQHAQRRATDAADLLQRQVAALETGSVRVQLAQLQRQQAHVQRQLQAMTRERDEWHRACTAAETRAADLDARCREQRQECAALERLILQAVPDCDGCREDSCDACPDLRGRRILCVGGRSQLIDQYRALVSRCNGRFEHHDGGIEDNRQRLEPMLSSADAVVCTTDCVSHDAYYRLKRFCKRHAKPYVLLRSSGISTFARALEAVAS